MSESWPESRDRSHNGTTYAAPGHNVAGVEIGVEVRFLNATTAYAGPGGTHQSLRLPAGTTVGELVARLSVPGDKLFLVLINGRDVTPGLVGAAVNGARALEDGDVVALSGPVPYSYGYGAPVV